jgi:chromate reductase
MSGKPEILAFAGSTRSGSYNKMLVKVAARGAEAAGASVTFVDLRDLPMPLYDGDLEEREGLPANAREFKDLLLAHQGLLIASPEYNSSMSGVFKNAVDWASRPVEGEPPLACFDGKICSLMSASPGGLGGIRGLVPVRMLLGSIGVVVLPDQVAVSRAHEAFSEDGNLKDARQRASVEELGANVARMIFKLMG